MKKSERYQAWKYYNHALLPSCAPHEEADLSQLDDLSEFYSCGKKPLFARWTSDYDKVGTEDWYYVVKEGPFDISSLKAKRRYEITRGLKNFTCKRIDPKEYVDEIYAIQEAAYETYPLKYRPELSLEKLKASVVMWDKVYGAFDLDGKLCSYANITCSQKYIDLTTLKSKPECEKVQVNAAIVYTILEDNKTFLEKGYICNGERNLVHETNFNEYLEKYFMFRKVYCRLNMRYFGKIKFVVKIAYPFRKLFAKSKIKLLSQINSVLKMEEIARKTGGKH